MIRGKSGNSGTERARTRHKIGHSTGRSWWTLFTNCSAAFHHVLLEALATHEEAAAMQPLADSAPRLVLVPFDARESITLAAAAKLSGKSTNTIRAWAELYGLGRKIGGTWHISRAALRMFLDGDTTALSAYHAGNRTDSAVQSYFEHVGCGALLQKSQKQVSHHSSTI
jgi:hypothetical protein